MLQNAYLLAKIGADSAENERNFAENLPKIGNYRARHPALERFGGAGGPEERLPAGGPFRGAAAALLLKRLRNN